MTDLLSILPYFYVIIIPASLAGTIISLIYAVWKFWDKMSRHEIRHSTVEWAVNEERLSRGKKPIIFDSKDSHVLTIEEKGERLYLHSINTPNRHLKEAMKLGVQLINEERQIDRLQAKHHKQKIRLLKRKEREIQKILSSEKKEMKKKRKKLDRIDAKLEQLLSKKIDSEY